MSFWKELQRRNVVKVGMAYAIAGWLIVHPVDIIFPTLHLPEWTTTFVTALFIIGFPFVLIFAWVYEVTPKGLKKTKDVPLSKSTTQLTGRKLNYITIGLLVLAVALLIFDNFYLDRGAVETKQVPVVGKVETAKKTIAVLPFENLSSDPEQVYFVDGLSEEILNSLAQIQDLNVIGRTSSFSFKGSNKTVQEIASVLGADHILEGSVRKAGNALRITAQLLRATDSVHLWSETYDRELKDIFAVQEDIATAVADELKATLGIDKSFRKLGGTDNVEAYELYLVAMGLEQKAATLTNINRALEAIDKSIKIDPKFALAWAYKAQIHYGLRSMGPGDRAAAEADLGLNAAQRAIELEPNLANGYMVLAGIKTQNGDFIDAELNFRKALEMENKTNSPAKYQSLALHYLSVGYLLKANNLLEEACRNDPLSSIRIWYMHSLAYLGDTKRAEEEYKIGKTLLGDQWIFADMPKAFFYLGTSDIFPLDGIEYSDPIYDIAKNYLHSPKEGLSELRRIYSDGNNLSLINFVCISVGAAYFGDPEFAMDAMEKAVSIESSSILEAWQPIMKDVRQTPRFKKLVKKIGLVDYWNKFGWPDICHKLDNGDFECD